MKTIYTTAFLIGVCLSSFAQVIDTNWTHQYDRVPSINKTHIAALPNGDYLISQQSQYYRINTDGDSLDAFAENTNWGTTYDMVGISDGVLLGGVFNGHAAIAKMDTSFSILWTTELPWASSETKDVFVDGNDIYASGKAGFSSDFIAKFDQNGDTVWTLQLDQTTFTQLSDIIKLSDGNFLASGNLDDYPLAVKFNSSGDTIWTYYEPLFISFQKMNAYERSSGEITLMAEHYMINLDANGNKLEEEDFSHGQYFDLEVEGDTVYLFGYERDSVFSNDRWPTVQVRNTAFDSLGSFRFLKGIHPMAGNSFHDAVRTAGGGYVVSGLIRDSVNITNNTYNIYAMKFNDLGPTGLSEANSLRELELFPNPTDGRVTLMADQSGLNVAVYDLQGNMILGQDLMLGENIISLDRLPAGCYLIRDSDGRFSRLIKH